MAKAKTSITTENRSGSAADAAAKEKRTEMPLSDLHPFEGHPFKVLDDELMEQTVESIKQIGVVSPLIVRPDPEGGFEILSGHRRLHAAQLAGLETVPVIVKEMDDDAAIIFMVDSNLQRENILPSERAFSYKMKLEAMKHQGQRGDLTSDQVGQKSWAVNQLADDANESKTYVHRTNNGKRISQYTCSQYSKVPVGKLCKTQHRINEDVVLSLVSEMLKAIAEYAKHDRAEFVRVVQEAQSSQQTAEVKKQRIRLATAKQRVSELEVLLCKIYEDNILGKLSDSRYATLDAQYEKEQTELTAEISALEKAVKSYEKHEKDADRFIALIDKYENFDKLTIAMLNEFIEKILVHERDRKGSIQTTQEVEIYFNFVGRFVPPAFGEAELTPEELEEIRKREERKDRLHQNYLKRKASGAQKRYEDKIKERKKAEIEAKKAAIRAEDIAKGVFVPVSSLPQREPMKGVQTA
ncbi:ParB/RepB/Spo0J family partition protein [Flavonifractor plautii]|nr:ParB/RepB/Spo0J family partition protein [Flavonifractor plautii]MCQ4785957.1 ParB/RepB/Spo0J family partition protein [Flavonifractor plautii]